MSELDEKSTVENAEAPAETAAAEKSPEAVQTETVCAAETAPDTDVRRRTSIGGQALLEGIMMRGPKVTAMAVRDPDGTMIIEQWPTVGTERGKIYKAPFIRGIFNMYDSLTFGYKCLMRSAEIAGLDEEAAAQREAAKAEKAAAEAANANAENANAAAAEAAETAETVAEAVAVEATEAASEETPAEAEAEISAEATAEAPTAATASQEASEEEQAAAAAERAALRDKIIKENEEAARREKKQKAQESIIMAISVVLGLALAVGLFLVLPTFVVKWLSGPLPFLKTPLWKSVFEGVLRILIFLGYMAAISLMKDIRRTFRYHGAEHKTIFCYENGLPLTVENVRRQKRFHPRCGTSFIILVLLVGIIVSMFITTENPLLRIVIKLLCLPVVVSVGYELIKLAGRSDNILTKIISAPGKALQHITVLEPDDDMIECAIAAFKLVIPDDGSDRW